MQRLKPRFPKKSAGTWRKKNGTQTQTLAIQVSKWMSYFTLQSYFFSKATLRWGTSPLSYLFSEPPMWATSALSPASSSVASATQIFSSLVHFICRHWGPQPRKQTPYFPGATLSEKTQGFAPESVFTSRVPELLLFSTAPTRKLLLITMLLTW